MALNNGETFDICEWSTAILMPSFWMRLKWLFTPHFEIMFCWGQDKYTIRGVAGCDSMWCGGVPDKIKEELERN